MISVRRVVAVLTVTAAVALAGTPLTASAATAPRPAGMASTHELTAGLVAPAAPKTANRSGSGLGLPAAVIPPAGAGLAMALAGGLTLVGIRRRRRSR